MQLICLPICPSIHKKKNNNKCATVLIDYYGRLQYVITIRWIRKKFSIRQSVESLGCARDRVIHIIYCNYIEILNIYK